MRAAGVFTTILLVVSAASAEAQISRVPRPRTGGTGGSKVVVHAEGGLGLPGPKLSYETTVPDNAEDALYTVELSRPASPALDVGAWGHLTSRIGVGVSVTVRQQTADGTVTGESPHPFFFDQPRAITGDVSSIDTRETAVHIEIVAPLRLGGLDISVFGGPSIINVRHSVLDTVAYADDYPYDTATFTSATTVPVQELGFGYNVGAEAGKMLTPAIGLGARVRYIGGSADLPTAGDAISFKISSLQVTAGVRLAF
jgi:hypothetical protein